MFRLLEFWKRNSTFILIILAFLFFMDFCGRIIIPHPENVTKKSISKEPVTINPNQGGLKSYEEIVMERSLNDKGNRLLLSWLAALAVVVIAGYYTHQKGWLKSFFPGKVAFSSVLLKEKVSKRLLMRLSLSNTTRESKTFLMPHLLFKKSSEVRRFKLKSEDFPLTLTSGTNHTMVIDIEQFWEKVPDLAKFSRIGAEINTTAEEVFTSGNHHKWWIYKRLWFFRLVKSINQQQ